LPADPPVARARRPKRLLLLCESSLSEVRMTTDYLKTIKRKITELKTIQISEFVHMSIPIFFKV
jgi:hypothetical protein